jgi:hypothetical protein
MISRIFFQYSEWIRPISHGILFIELLLISHAKGKIAFGLKDSLRSQSYRISFVLVILYFLLLALISFGVGFLFEKNEQL